MLPDSHFLPLSGHAVSYYARHCVLLCAMVSLFSLGRMSTSLFEPVDFQTVAIEMLHHRVHSKMSRNLGDLFSSPGLPGRPVDTSGEFAGIAEHHDVRRDFVTGVAAYLCNLPNASYVVTTSTFSARLLRRISAACSGAPTVFVRVFPYGCCDSHPEYVASSANQYRLFVFGPESVPTFSDTPSSRNVTCVSSPAGAVCRRTPPAVVRSLWMSLAVAPYLDGMPVDAIVVLLGRSGVTAANVTAARPCFDVRPSPPASSEAIALAAESAAPPSTSSSKDSPGSMPSQECSRLHSQVCRDSTIVLLNWRAVSNWFGTVASLDAVYLGASESVSFGRALVSRRTASDRLQSLYCCAGGVWAAPF